MTNQTPREQRARLFEIDDQDAISPFALYSPNEIAELQSENARLRAQVAALEVELVKVRESAHENYVYLESRISALTEQVAALVQAGRDALGVVQASLVNARERNEYPAIIANLECKEANLRAALTAAESEAAND